MRVLLTGAAGFVGAHTLRHLLAETDFEFVCPVSFQHKGVPERIEWAVEDVVDEVGCGKHGGWSGNWSRVHVIRHDLATPINTTTAGRIGPIDLVLNFASDTHPPRSVQHPVEFVQNNVNLMLHLLEWARAQDRPPLFVQISTDAVYGPALGDQDEHHEWDPHVPNNPYSASKACQEDLLIAWWRSYNLPAMICATMNPTGVTQDVEKFIPMTIGRLLKGDPVTIHTDVDGFAARRTYIDAADVASAVLFLVSGRGQSVYVRRPGDGLEQPQRFNIVGPRELDVAYITRLVAAELDVKPDITFEVVDRPEHGHRYAMSGHKLAAEGWQPSLGIEDTIRHMARWYRANPMWLA